jgi:hypothetical protein
MACGRGSRGRVPFVHRLHADGSGTTATVTASSEDIRQLIRERGKQLFDDKPVAKFTREK